ncbi:Clavaminate synthase-like protein [Ascodesmis nigricans]|uniref:Clavaminate synthase-like protein n=1 Tax=Ascodesmis nigricans TaxID=341454 RepID=A0A4V3SI32_9PEZI|nr:Clavaminate synthase-like protein [Ascodesmis nigricans]
MDSPIPILKLDDTPECTNAILAAARDLGFLYISLENSGISPSEVDQLFAISKQFFKETPTADKAACSISADNKGWSAEHSEVLDPEAQKRGDFKQAFNLGEFSLSGHAQQPLPPLLQSQEPYLSHFTQLCQKLSQKLLSHFSTALGLDPTYFHASHTPETGPSGSILRLLFYPAVPADFGSDPSDMRAGAHSDYGSLTLLFQRPGQPGLEILMPKSAGGGWRKVPVIENAVCVNIGDLLSYWTGGLLKSTVHRVVGQKGGEERFSVAYFCHPVNTTRLERIPSEMVREMGERGANEGKVLTAMEHLEGRLAATYGWKKK